MKKTNILMLGSLSFIVLAGCTNNVTSSSEDSPSSVEESSTSIEVDPLETALKDAKTNKIAISGKSTHTYYYGSVAISTKDVTRTSTFTTSFEDDAWTFSNLDSGIGKVTNYTSHFKDDDGFLAEEYIEGDNSVVLVPTLSTDGGRQLFAPKYENPFKLLSAEDFSVDGDCYILSGEKAQLFVARVFDEAFSDGSLKFTIKDEKFSSISAEGFVSSDYLYAKEDSFAREKGLSFEANITKATKIYHISSEKEKNFETLQTALDATSSGKFRIQNGSSVSSMGFDAYFDGTNILATFNVGATSPSDEDMYFTPGEDGTLNLYIYSSNKSSWVPLEDTDYAGEIYNYPMTYDEIAPKMYEVSADIFNKSSYSNGCYNTASNATKYVGKYFVSMLYDQIGYPEELFRNSVSSFQLSNITTNSFDIAVVSSYGGTGYTVTSDFYLQVSSIGKCHIPYKVTINK